MTPDQFGDPRYGDPTRIISEKEYENFPGSQFTERYEVDLFNIDLLLEDDIKEIVSNVVGEGYRWVWLLTKTSVQKAHRKAVINLKYSAGRKGCNAVIGVTTNVPYFPGFLGFRGCSVFLTGTAVRI